MKVLKAFFRIVCFVLIAAVISAAVFFRPGSAVEMNAKADNNYGGEVPLLTGGEYKKIASSGFTELYFNSMNAGIAVRETSQNKTWYSSYKGTNSDVILNIKTSDSEYVLSSNQCVRQNGFKSQAGENGVSVEYTMSCDSDGAESKNDMAFKVTVDYTLKDGNFFVKADIADDHAGSAAVTSFRVLPFFGAFDDPADSDYFVLPDGCGAAVYPYYAQEPADYACRVYGADLSYEDNDCAGACFGAFGLKYRESAYAAIINKGEEYATVKAHCGRNEQSCVYADFCFDGIFEKNGKAYASLNAEKSIEICYKFLSSENASYTEIASSCREQFIRNGILPTASVKDSDSLPMFLTVNGAYKSNIYLPGYEKLTTFDQALDIIKRIKSKGIDNINVRYQNVYAPDSVYTASALGGKKDLKELTDYTSSLNVPLYFDANVNTFTSHFGSFTLFGAKRADKMTYSLTSDLAADGMPEYGFTYRFRTANGTGRFVSRLIDKARDYNISGICLNDGGKYLCSDLSGEGTDRNYVKNYISSQIPAMQNLGGICVENGNLYTVKNSSAIINIPMSTHYEQTEAYRKIPFIQTVYHGMTVLAGEPINAKTDIHAESLRCIEYGVCPNFSTVYAGAETAAIIFKNAQDIIIKEYNYMADAVSGLEGERITDHSCVKDNVYCTSYSNGTRIYVNYNKEKVTINGITIQGNSYLKIK